MKKIDRLIAKNSRTHSMIEYENAINAFIGYNQKDETKKEDVRLAKVLRFYIEFFRSLRDKERYEFINDVLDYYSNIVPNEKDLFQRPIIEFHIPENIKKKLYKGFIEFNNNREIELQQDAEQLLAPDLESERVTFVVSDKLKQQIYEEYLKLHPEIEETFEEDGNENEEM